MKYSFLVAPHNKGARKYKDFCDYFDAVHAIERYIKEKGYSYEVKRTTPTLAINAFNDSTQVFLYLIETD